MKLSEAARILQQSDKADAEAVGRLIRSKRIDRVSEALELSLSDMKQGAQFHSAEETIEFRARLAACVASPLCMPPSASESINWIQNVREWGKIHCIWEAFALGSVVELSGESGSGKTQLALQMAADIQRAVEGAETAYVCTEGPFPSTRFDQIVSETKKRYECDDIDFTGNVHVLNAVNTTRDKITARFRETERMVLERCGAIRLVVVDSITALFRGEYGAGEAVERAAVLADVAGVLHQIAATGVCVLVLNQVTDVIGGDGADVLNQGATEGQTMPVWSSRDVVETEPPTEAEAAPEQPWVIRRTAPALNLSWATAVNSRLMLSKTPGGGSVRVLQVIWSPTVAKGTWIRCVVDAEGIHPPLSS